MPMSPCRYTCCPCVKTRNEVLGLLRQRKLLNSQETGRSSNPSVFTRISFIGMKAKSFDDFSQEGVASQDTRVCLCVCKGGER